MRVSATTALCFTEFTVRLRGVIGDGFMASLVVVVAAVGAGFDERWEKKNPPPVWPAVGFEKGRLFKSS
jgi:hypothetical protein